MAEFALSPAWRKLENGLAEVLSVLEEDQYLIISAKRGWAYVQFAAQGSFGLRAESVSNHYAFESNALSPEQIDALEKLGWSPPTGTPPEATPKPQPEGSPNFFRDYDRPVPFPDVARLAVRTLAEVHRIPHPGYLEYQAFQRDGGSILIPTLGLKVRPSAPRKAKKPSNPVVRARGLVLKAIRKASGNPDLRFNKQGHLTLRFRSAVVIVRVQKDPLCVSVTSPLLGKIQRTDGLVNRLNDLNAKLRFARLFVRDDVVYAAVEVSASPIVAEHVVRACELVGNLADHFDGMLQWEFGGRTAFGGVPVQAFDPLTRAAGGVEEGKVLSPSRPSVRRPYLLSPRACAGVFPGRIRSPFFVFPGRGIWQWATTRCSRRFCERSSGTSWSSSFQM